MKKLFHFMNNMVFSVFPMFAFVYVMFNMQKEAIICLSAWAMVVSGRMTITKENKDEK